MPFQRQVISYPIALVHKSDEGSIIKQELVSGLKRLAFSRAHNAYAIVLMAATAYLIAAKWLVALTWDGSGSLFHSLQNGAPYISHHRLSNYPLLLALVEGGRWTSDGQLLGMLYGVLLAVTPIGSLALSLFFLRGSRLEPLRIWPVIGILLATLPGEICLMSEASLAVQAFWPIPAFLFAGAPGWAWPWVALLSVYLFFLHPTSSVLFALCAIIAAYCLEGRRRVTCWAATFGLLAITRFLFSWEFATSYERSELHFSPNWHAFHGSILGMPLFLLAGLYLLAVVAFLRGTNRLPSPSTRRIIWGALLLLILAGFVWAFDPRLWSGAISYRRFVLVCSLPLIALATLHQRWVMRQNITITTVSPTARLSLFATAIFSAIYVVEAFSWRSAVTRFEKVLSVAAGPYLTLKDLPWAQETALDHWGSTPLSAILQGRSPRVLFAMHPEDIHGANIYLFPGDELGVKDGWFLLAHRAATLKSSDKPTAYSN